MPPVNLPDAAYRTSAVDEASRAVEETRTKLLPFARELCAAMAEADGNWKPAENYRAGYMDDSTKVRLALEALELAAAEQVQA